MTEHLIFPMRREHKLFIKIKAKFNIVYQYSIKGYESIIGTTDEETKNIKMHS